MEKDEMAKRIERLMEYYELSASAFSNKIKVPRSSISHLLNGRNKPSLEFVMKVVEAFDEVDFYWLVYGQGNFPQDVNPNLSSRRMDKTLVPQDSLISQNKGLERIVFFYKDGTFEEYRPH